MIRRNADPQSRRAERAAAASGSPEDMVRAAHQRRRRGEHVDPWELNPISYVFLQAYELGPDGRVEATWKQAPAYGKPTQRFYVGSGMGMRPDRVEQYVNQGFIPIPTTSTAWRSGDRRSDPMTLEGVAGRFGVPGWRIAEANLSDLRFRAPNWDYERFFDLINDPGFHGNEWTASGESQWGPDVWGLTLEIPPRYPMDILTGTNLAGAGPGGGGGGWLLQPARFTSARLMKRYGKHRDRWKNPPNPVPRPGDRIELVSMFDDPDPVLPGTRGTATHVQPVDLGAPNKFWQVSVDWDNGRSLMLSIPPDRVRYVGRRG